MVDWSLESFSSFTREVELLELDFSSGNNYKRGQLERQPFTG